MDKKVSICWFRKDLRLNDHLALKAALDSENEVVCLYIFDPEMYPSFGDGSDPRTGFILDQVSEMKDKLREKDSDLIFRLGKTGEVWEEIFDKYDVEAVYASHDYEPQEVKRDEAFSETCEEKGVEFVRFHDRIVMGPEDALKDDGDPYLVFTPYKKRFLENLKAESGRLEEFKLPFSNLLEFKDDQYPDLEGYKRGAHESLYPPKKLAGSMLEDYGDKRDFPAKDATSRLSMHLAHGTVSIRELSRRALSKSDVWMSELIWRNFYYTLAYLMPKALADGFKEGYNRINWINDEDQFERWKEGKTGYPIVDAGMRQLNETGYMHNRVRMIVASFLVKHLLIDWRWGEAYFAEKLLDFDLPSNNGGWQWASGSGCDAAPYFRIFNPYRQQERFDPKMKYIKDWVPEYGSDKYPDPIVPHKEARKRAIDEYKKALG